MEVIYQVFVKIINKLYIYIYYLYSIHYEGEVNSVNTYIFMPPASIDRGHIVLPVSVCLPVRLSAEIINKLYMYYLYSIHYEGEVNSVNTYIFFAPRIDRSGPYCFTGVRLSVRLSVRPSVCLLKT